MLGTVVTWRLSVVMDRYGDPRTVEKAIRRHIESLAEDCEWAVATRYRNGQVYLSVFDGDSHQPLGWAIFSLSECKWHEWHLPFSEPCIDLPADNLVLSRQVVAALRWLGGVRIRERGGAVYLPPGAQLPEMEGVEFHSVALQPGDEADALLRLVIQAWATLLDEAEVVYKKARKDNVRERALAEVVTVERSLKRLLDGPLGEIAPLASNLLQECQRLLQEVRRSKREVIDELAS